MSDEEYVQLGVRWPEKHYRIIPSWYYPNGEANKNPTEAEWNTFLEYLRDTSYNV